MNATSEYLSIGASVVALAALAALVNYVIAIVRGVQEMRHAENPPRNPPLPELVAKDYATKRDLACEIGELKKELRDERARVDGIFKQLFDQGRELTAKLGEWQLGIERLIGKIEGRINK